MLENGWPDENQISHVINLVLTRIALCLIKGFGGGAMQLPGWSLPRVVSFWGPFGHLGWF
jgi:hypothetical protein